jgi:hypothetical protein
MRRSVGRLTLDEARLDEARYSLESESRVGMLPRFS